eukprot:TRINITY_DN37522_c0_g1_i1.p1 TRINITY_DN37522_c0_g1~~TRINITY_DN37522_c0_g1_i1.p1  ORF type:complete len:523 (-),score=76.99 TRINITY_DN37522_c0_g1_i1:115-1683(-)
MVEEEREEGTDEGAVLENPEVALGGDIDDDGIFMDGENAETGVDVSEVLVENTGDPAEVAAVSEGIFDDPGASCEEGEESYGILDAESLGIGAEFIGAGDADGAFVAAHKKIPQGRPRWLRNLSSTEELVHELMRNRLFGCLDADAQPRNNNSRSCSPGSSRDHRKASSVSTGTPCESRIFPPSSVMEPGCTFAPTINARSRILAQRTADSSVSSVDALYNKPQSLVERWNAKRAEMAHEVMKDLTFTPKVNPNSKELSAQRPPAGQDRWTQMSVPTRRTEKTDKSEQTEKMEKANVRASASSTTSRAAWVSSLRPGESPFQPRQDADTIECSFAPRIRPSPKYLSKKIDSKEKIIECDAEAEARDTAAATAATGKDALSRSSVCQGIGARGEGRGENRRSTATRGREQSNSCESLQRSASPCSPQQAAVSPRTPKRATSPNSPQQMVLSVHTPQREAIPRSPKQPASPYTQQRPGGLWTSNQYMPSRLLHAQRQQGLTQNVVDLDDPIFHDLHSMLHSLQL